MDSPPEWKDDNKVVEQEVADDGSNYSQDELDMRRLGKLQETRRTFGLLPLLGFTTIMLCSWESVWPFFGIAVVNGGGPTLVYGYIFCFLGSLAQCASLSEVASMYPTSGGQYHWVALLAPPEWSNFLSWLTGWVSVLGWQAGCASGTFLGGTIIQGLLLLNDPTYNYKLWHGTMLMYAVLVLTVFVNTIAVRILPTLEGVILVIHVLGFFAILIPMVHLSPISDPSFVFQNWMNMSGYPDGLSWFVGLTTSSVLFVGYDGACHMAEEVKNASMNVPRSMFFTIFLNGALGFAMILVLLFCFGDVEAAFETVPWPFIEIFQQGVRSKAGATALTSILIALIIFATFGYLASASRQLWAFARDKGVPGSRLISRVDKNWQIPLYAIACTAVFNALLGLINIGSTTAFNAIVSLVAAGLFSSYIITISLMVRKRLRGDPIEFGPWKMPVGMGLPINIIALGYSIIAMVFSFFPMMIPVDATTMNWSCVVYGFVIISGLFFWVVRGRYVYEGPVMNRQFTE